MINWPDLTLPPTNLWNLPKLSKKSDEHEDPQDQPMSAYSLTYKEYDMAEEWLNSHECDGGVVGYRFIMVPTHIGVKKVVECLCGKHLGLTDYSRW